MRAIMMIAVAAVTPGLAPASSGATEQLRYWGKEPGATAGVIELGHEQYYTVVAGTQIPSWGRVKEVGDSSLTLERIVTETQKSDLRERGALVHDVFHIQIPREDLQQIYPPGARRKDAAFSR